MRSGFGRIAGTAATLALLAGTGLATAHAGGTGTPDFKYHANPPRHFAFKYGGTSKIASNQAACVAAYALNCYQPADIRKAYNIPANFTGAGQTITIVDAYGSPTIRQDLHTFDQAFGLPDPQLNILTPVGPISFDATDPNQLGWAGETSLDVEWAHAVAPAATIDLVEAPNNWNSTLTAAEQYVISNRVGNVMSMSFGDPEDDIINFADNQDVKQDDALYQVAKAENMTVVTSAGDSGAANFYPNTNSSSPASDPYVTTVGGTDLFTNSDGTYKNETVWNDEGQGLCPYGCPYGAFGATGGAVSQILYSLPFEQAVTGNTWRAGADVSFNASVYTAVLVYAGFYPSASDNGFYFYGGTSEGAPAWAGIVADANQIAGHPLGFLNPRLYAILANPAQYAADFHDVTVGNNAFEGPGFNAGLGYDIPTGLGSPNVANLVATLSH